MNHDLQHGNLYIVLVGWIALRGLIEFRSCPLSSSYDAWTHPFTASINHPIVDGYTMTDLQTKMMSVRRRKPEPLAKFPAGAWQTYCV